LIQDLQEKSKISSANILILGAGGSALSIIPSIADCLPKNILLDNRSQEKIQPLIERFNNLTTNNSMIDNIDHFEDDIDIVINATSAGFSGAFNWYRDLNLSKKTFFYDLSYTKDNSKTPFLNWAIQYSDNYSDGFGMLINQAALSYELWTGIMPGTTINKSDLIND
jgi:shikimate dehydrogenase